MKAMPNILKSIFIFLSMMTYLEAKEFSSLHQKAVDDCKRFHSSSPYEPPSSVSYRKIYFHNLIRFHSLSTVPSFEEINPDYCIKGVNIGLKLTREIIKIQKIEQDITEIVEQKCDNGVSYVKRECIRGVLYFLFYTHDDL
jgi:hypothetical protein